MAKSATKTIAKNKPAAKTGPADHVSADEALTPASQRMPKKKSAAAGPKIGAPPKRVGDEILYWLFKSEPDKFSWDNLVAKGAEGEEWDGIRNYLARNNMREMRLGDLGFFYHSNAGKDVVGICEVSGLAHPDSTTDDERWECVDVRAICPMPTPVTLAAVKATPELAAMALVTSMRLSVQPVTASEWAIVCRMGGLDPLKLVASGASSKPIQRGNDRKT